MALPDFTYAEEQRAVAGTLLLFVFVAAVLLWWLT